MRVLEIGFGDAYGAQVLAPIVLEYVGLEVSEAAVDHARANRSLTNASFRVYSGSEIPFAANSFDVVLSFHVLEHLTDAEPFVAEMARVCAPGGTIALVTPNAAFRTVPGERPWSRFHVHEFTASELEKLISRHLDGCSVSGISGSREMNALEAARVARARRLARIDVLGLRYKLPEAALFPVRRLLMSVGKHAARSKAVPQFGLADVRCVAHDVEHAPHLFAVGTVEGV